MESIQKQILDQGKKQVQKHIEKQTRQGFVEVLVAGVDAATKRIQDLKAQGKLNQMAPELKAAIRRLCAEAPPQLGGKKTRKHKGKKSTKKKRRKHHKKTHKKRK